MPCCNNLSASRASCVAPEVFALQTLSLRCEAAGTKPQCVSLNSRFNITMIFSHAEPVCYVDMTHPHKASVVLGYKHSHKICQRGSVNNIIAAGAPMDRH